MVLSIPNEWHKHLKRYHLFFHQEALPLSLDGLVVRVIEPDIMRCIHDVLTDNPNAVIDKIHYIRSQQALVFKTKDPLIMPTWSQKRERMYGEILSFKEIMTYLEWFQKDSIFPGNGTVSLQEVLDFYQDVFLKIKTIIDCYQERMNVILKEKQIDLRILCQYYDYEQDGLVCSFYREQFCQQFLVRCGENGLSLSPASNCLSGTTNQIGFTVIAEELRDLMITLKEYAPFFAATELSPCSNSPFAFRVSNCRFGLYFVNQDHLLFDKFFGISSFYSPDFLFAQYFEKHVFSFLENVYISLSSLPAWVKRYYDETAKKKEKTMNYHF